MKSNEPISRGSIIELRAVVHQNMPAASSRLLPGADRPIAHARCKYTRASINIAASDADGPRGRLSFGHLFLVSEVPRANDLVFHAIVTTLLSRWTLAVEKQIFQRSFVLDVKVYIGTSNTYETPRQFLGFSLRDPSLQRRKSRRNAENDPSGDRQGSGSRERR